VSRLLNESWIEGLPDSIVENLEALNRYVILRVCERIRKIGDIGAADAHRLKSAVEYAAGDLRAIEAEIARIAKQNVKDIDALFEEVAAENLDFASVYFAARDMDPIQNYAQVAALESFVRAAKSQAMDGVTNISNTYMIGFKRGRTVVPLREYYISAIDRAITFVKIGTVDYHTAVRSTVKDMAKSGLRRVTFESGYSRRLDSQARMNILEGVQRLNGEMMEETSQRFGADGVEISAHALCAPDHLGIQGRQYRREQWDRINGSLRRPLGTLNCHHFATPIIYGVSRPVYSPKELAEINRRSTEMVEWKGRKMTRYEASQKQRQLETAIRYAKDERDAMTAAGDKLGAAQARKKSAALGREYKAFCETTGLTPRPERTRSMKGATTGGLANPGGNGILKSTGVQGIPVTEEAISRVPLITPSGWSAGKAVLLQEAHKDLLRFVEGQPVGIEAGAIYSLDMKLLERRMGRVQEIRMPRYSGEHILIHNHPDGLTFSPADIEGFGKRFDMKILTAVGHNGTVYILQKTEEYNPVGLSKAFLSEMGKLDSAKTPEEFAEIINRFLEGVGNYGVRFISGR